MPRMQPPDQQSRVIIRGKTPIIGTRSKRVEQGPPNPERGMKREEHDGERSVVAPSRRAPAGVSRVSTGDERPPLQPGERAPAPPVGERKGRGFPDRIEALETQVANQADGIEILFGLRDRVSELLEFKTDVTMALKDFAGRIGACESFVEIVVPALKAHGITLSEDGPRDTQKPPPDAQSSGSTAAGAEEGKG